MKHALHFLSGSLFFGAIAWGLCDLAGAQTPNKAETETSSTLDAINEGLNTNEGGSLISIIKDTADHGLNRGAAVQQGAAWRAAKMGAPGNSAAHQAIRAHYKKVSDLLGNGGVLIDHAGYASTAAGELAEGNFAQGFITIADGLGKIVVSGIGAATGASFGAPTGPATMLAAGAAGGYASSHAWDASVGRLMGEIKAGLARQEARRQFRELAGIKMLGRSAEGIHEAYLQYRRELDAKKKAGAAKSVATNPKPSAEKLPAGSQTAVYDPSNGGGDNIRVTVSGVANFKQESVPGWRNNGTSFGATGSRSTPIGFSGTIVTKNWSYYDFKNSVVVKADEKEVYRLSPKISKDGGSASFSFTFNPASSPGVHTVSIDVSSTGGNPESSTHWVGGTVQIAE